MPNVKLLNRRRSVLRNPRPGRAADLRAVDGLFGRSVEAVADAIGKFIAVNLSRSARLRPVGAEPICLHYRANGVGHRRHDGTFATAGGPLHRPLHGRAHRLIPGAKLPRQGEKLDHGGERLRNRRTRGFGLRSRTAASHGVRLSRYGFRKVYLRRDRRVGHVFHQRLPRAAPRPGRRVLQESPGQPTPSSIRSFICASRAITSKARTAWAMSRRRR